MLYTNTFNLENANVLSSGRELNRTKMIKLIYERVKNIVGKEMLVCCNFSFSHKVFKWPLSQCSYSYRLTALNGIKIKLS